MGEESLGVACREEMDGGGKLRGRAQKRDAWGKKA